MFNALADLLAFFYDVWPDYGGAIVLFTAAIMLLLTPLSIKSTRSMIAMQRLQPELKKLQQQYKDDRESLNREMMAFYAEHKINPFSSCLPLLLQMPIFIVLYRVLSGLTRMGDDGTFNPSYISQDSKLYEALDGAERMRSFGMDLSRSAMGELQDEGIVTALPFIVLVGLVVVTGIVQQRQIAGRNPGQAANPQQQMIARIMPFIFIPISISIPAGVVIYFVVSNVVRIGQQAVVTRLEFPPGAPAGGKHDPAAAGITDASSTPKTEPDPKVGRGDKGDKGDQGAKGPSSRPAPTGRTGGNGAGPKRPSNRSRNRKKKRK